MPIWTRELEAHIAYQVDENISAGMSADEARRQAYLKLGSPKRRVRKCMAMEYRTVL